MGTADCRTIQSLNKRVIFGTVGDRRKASFCIQNRRFQSGPKRGRSFFVNFLVTGPQTGTVLFCQLFGDSGGSSFAKGASPICNKDKVPNGDCPFFVNFLVQLRALIIKTLSLLGFGRNNIDFLQQ